MKLFRVILAVLMVLALALWPFAALAGPSPLIGNSCKTLTAATTTAGTGVSFTGAAAPIPTPTGSRIGPRVVLISTTATAAAYFEGTVTFYCFNDNGGIATARDLSNLAGGSSAIQLKGWEGQQRFEFVGDGPDSASITVTAGTTPKVTFKW